MSTKHLVRKSESRKGTKRKSLKKSARREFDVMRDSVLVHVDQADGDKIPKLGAKFLPTETFFCLKEKGGEPFQLITTTPSGMNIGWTSCGNCHMHFKHCSCKTFTVPRSVEVACDQDQAIIDGEEWSIHHPNYRGSIREKINRSHHRAGDALTKSLSTIVSEPKTKEIKTEYDKKRLDKKVKSQSKRSLSEFKRLVGAPEGSQKKHLKGATSGSGTRKRSLKRRA